MMRKYPLILAYTCVLVFALKSRRATKYIMDLTKSQLIDLLLLLAPLNAALHSIQTDETPSLHLVIPFCQKLLQDYSTYSKLVSSAKKKYPLIFNSSFVADYLLNESSGMYFTCDHLLINSYFITTLIMTYSYNLYEKKVYLV
ncbi:unnamed protein product [Rotaria magnacalcarata]|uniref:Uncharacterized protein n=2 Tax=Rotaria magnacalcarata TaxID=392030 RepID=A0A814N8N8_9BILA|nr:unnamed protein product [Rotaria magnacalcarata]